MTADVHSGCNPAIWSVGTDGALGSLTGYCPDSGNNADFEFGPDDGLAPEARASVSGLAGLAREFEVRSSLRPYVADPRIAICGARVYGDPEIVTREYESGDRRSHWRGVILCNRAGCPVCGAIRARRFAERIRRTLGAGGIWQHVVLTVPHSAGDAWSAVYARLLAGVRELSHGTCGQIVMRDVVSATIRATESTWSVRSGWHVHCHLLWALRRPLIWAEKSLVAEHWALRTGASIDRGVRFGRLFDCSRAIEQEQAAKYVSKLACEIAGAGKHAHSEHWQLSELYERAATGDRRYIDLVVEYQSATKGRRIYQFDRRARQLHDAASELPELVVTAEWRTAVWREEFAGLSRVERYRGERLAIYLPLEAAATARGDPADDVLETIASLLSAYDS